MSKFKQNKAVALRYRTDDNAAPIVIASGYGDTAERIVDVAEQKGIPVFRDDSIASMLCMLDVGRSIPPELYEVVAAVYCRILAISKDIKESGGLLPPGGQGLLDGLLQSANEKEEER